MADDELIQELAKRCVSSNSTYVGILRSSPRVENDIGSITARLATILKLLVKSGWRPPGTDAPARTDDEPSTKVLITLPADEAESLSYSLSDLLCWLAGYKAGLPSDDRGEMMPMGVEAARTLNLKIKAALEAYEQRGKSL